MADVHRAGGRDTELVAYTTEEGGEWHFVQAHAVVVDGMRWDMKSRVWAKYFEPVLESWRRHREQQGVA